MAVSYDERRPPVVEVEATVLESILTELRDLREAVNSQSKRMQALQDEFTVFQEKFRTTIEEVKTIVDLAYGAAGDARAIATRLEGANGVHPREYPIVPEPPDTESRMSKGDTDPGLGGPNA